jgi:hypothetical protein
MIHLRSCAVGAAGYSRCVETSCLRRWPQGPRHQEGEQDELECHHDDVLRRPRRRTAEQRAYLTQLCAEDPAVATAVDLAADFFVTLRRSNGQTEGQVTRLKLVKRQGHGRPRLALLR